MAVSREDVERENDAARARLQEAEERLLASLREAQQREEWPA